MRICVTGSGGFVGGHLVRCLVEHGDEVVRVQRDGSSDSVDILDAVVVERALESAVPDAVIHLAAQPSVPESWQDPELTYRVNVLGTLNVLRALKGTSSKLLLVGSAQQYSPIGDGSPITEAHPMKPSSPYAASKIAAEELAFLLADHHGFSAVATRSFNHTGPGQTPLYAVGSFAKQIVEVAGGSREPRIEVGDLSPRRDLLDVRDVVLAYRLLLDQGVSGQAYNVCSGQAIGIGEVLDLMLKSAGLFGEVEVIEKPDARKNEADVMVGDPSKLKAATGWAPGIPLEKSLADTLDWYRIALEREEP